MPPNDYKTDQDKPPVLDALVPFYPALEWLARMMQDAARLHKLEGAKDPFNEWRQLPNAKARLSQAWARHMLKGPWVNDDRLPHPHAVLALFNNLAALTLHAEELEQGTFTATHTGMCCEAPDARPIHGPAGADWRERIPPITHHHGHALVPRCICGHPKDKHAKRATVGAGAGPCYASAGCNCPEYREE